MSENTIGYLYVEKPWVKTSDRLPPFDLLVLGINKDGVRIVSITCSEVYPEKRYWINGGSDACCCSDSFDDNITHWALIPPLPEVGNE